MFSFLYFNPSQQTAPSQALAEYKTGKPSQSWGTRPISPSGQSEQNWRVKAGAKLFIQAALNRLLQ
nr:MAG TPA: hypothetical protein [Caudoviricetes sp.]